MSFINDIRKMQIEKMNVEEDVITEIVKYFESKYNSKEYEDYLKSKIEKQIKESRRTLTLNVEFWEYHSGCSTTHIEGGGVTFSIPYNEEYSKNLYYKSVRLEEVQHDICDRVSNILLKKLKELGLTIVSVTRHDGEYRFDYHKETIVISW